MAKEAARPMLPAPPPAELDDVLDAAERCFARFGVRRTSVPDIAAELGVDRTTVYRRAGSIEQIALMLANRETHRFLDMLGQLVGRGVTPEGIVEVVATIVETTLRNPVGRKLMTDERELVASFVARNAGDFITQTSAVLVPILSKAMKDGTLAKRDPEVVAQWLVRVGLSLVLVEADSDVRGLLATMLLPALTPSKVAAKKARAPRHR